MAVQMIPTDPTTIDFEKMTYDSSEKEKPASARRMSAVLLVNAMSVSALAEYCMREMNKFRCDEPYTDQYCLELLHRATVQRDAVAWEVLQHRFNETVLRWIRRHPQRDLACRLDSEENYIAQAFARFWQATVSNQKRELEFQSLAAALRYLRASLHAAILDTLQAYLRPKERPLPEPGEPDEPLGEDEHSVDVGEVWEIIRRLLPHEREQRLAYLLFHCGLKPREVVQFCADEFREIQEIYRLRRNIVERLVRNGDYIRWLLQY